MPPSPTGKPTSGKRPRRLSEFGKRLVAKQEAKKEYGLRERQFRKYFDLARVVRGATGEKLLELLERRLDNVLYRLDLAQTRAQARQMVNHGHVKIQAKKVTIPSYQVQLGEEITVKTPSLIHPRGVDVPSWLKPNGSQTGGTVQALPSRAEIATEIDEQMIVEYYSR